MPGYASFSSSVRYLGASALAFSTNSIICFSSSLGGAVVRVATGTPTSRKNLSLPAGEQMHIMRACADDRCLAAEGYFDLSVEQNERLFEVMAMRAGAAAWRDMHVDYTESVV